MDTNIMICMRCGAWHNGCCNQRECGINGVLKTECKNQGFNCKYQRYEYNRGI